MAGVRAQEAGLNTPEDVLQRAQEMAICELLAQPQVRRAVRQTFLERALISTREPRMQLNMRRLPQQHPEAHNPSAPVMSPAALVQTPGTTYDAGVCHT